MIANSTKQALLAEIFNNSLFGATLKGVLFNSFPGRAGNPTSNVTTYTGYAAQDLAADDTSRFTIAAPGEVRLAAPVAFDPQTDDGTQEVSFFGVCDGLTAGDNILAVGALGGSAPLLFSSDSGNLITTGTHGLAANDRVVLYDVPYNLSFPSGGSVAVGTVYHVIASGLTTTAFKISATQGGAELALGAGHGLWQKIRPVQMERDRSVSIKSYAQEAVPLIVLS